MHNSWQLKKDGFEEHKRELISLVNEKKIKVEELLKAKDTYLILRTKELFDSEIKLWEKERDIFYNNLRQTFKNVIDGDYDYVITAINSIFLEDELPMEYFADVVYDEQHGKVYVDLDLPEIEDIPNKKIVLTSSGKKSIRLKSQTDMRADYANCVLGLSMYIAYLIFNVSIKVSEIELMAYTQRKEDNSAIATDQYVFVINYGRDIFSQIDFNRLTSTQIIDFFKHHINLSKSYVMKQIDLSTAFDKMDNFVVADYNEFRMSAKWNQ
jgi:hypothetical protein